MDLCSAHPMRSDKEVKAWFKKEASAHPEKYYPTQALKEKGFMRKQCTVTGTYFWTLHADQQVCGDAEAQGGFSFIGNPPTKKRFDYLSVWPAFRNFFEQRGYMPLDRYPVVARWRDDVYWVGASVYPFQPYVVRGEAQPPSNAVIIPQPSLRFNDVDNVGVTGSHFTCFDMLGQLHFEKKEQYRPEVYFQEYFDWITIGMGIPAEELTIHEDAWAGGGTFGPCMEFFSRGMEIGNQVYMQFQTLEDGHKELDIKVLDMGQGHERVPWLTSGESSSYDTTFPTVTKTLYARTGFKKNDTVLQRFLPFAALLNADEVEDMDKAWETVAQKVGMPVKDLRDEIEPLTAIYSIAEHTRAALIGLNDGALPSNVGGGYNMRIILRRALGFIEKYGWDVDICGLTEEHARFLRPLYPELHENIQTVNDILDSEKRKYKATLEKSKSVLSSVIEKEITDDILIQLYDSQGIAPELVAQAARAKGKTVDIPSDFYAKVTERHERTEQKTATKKQIAIPTAGETTVLYFDDYMLHAFDATVVACGKLPEAEADHTRGYVELDRTAFYPTSGGQMHDTGVLNNVKVIDVFKKDNAIIHVVEDHTLFTPGMTVHGIVDAERRIQLSQHHTGAHIVNASARTVLGRHINQAGASKDVDKARLDITHYENLSDEQIKSIEREANEIIAQNIPVTYEILPREAAERKHSMRIYQGGFIPGRNLRIVSIGDRDTQACGGTHVKHTGELETLKITGSTRVQDGVIRVNFVAGNAAKKTRASTGELSTQVATLLGVDQQQIPDRAEEIFAVWKKVTKAAKKGPVDSSLFTLSSTKTWDGDALQETARRLKTQPEHVLRTLTRFLNEIEEIRKKQ